MNKITSDELNNLGAFTSLDAVYAKYPSGGVNGNYVIVGNTKLYWDEQALRWTSNGSYDGPTSQVVEGDLSVGGNLDVAGDAHVGGDVTIDGTLNVSSINLTDPIPVPKDGQSVFKSIVFKRAASRPTALTSSDGTFYNPVPTAKGWSDGIPSGTDPIWMCSRIFTNDGEPPQGTWSRPELMADTESFDVEFSDSVDRPANPNGTNQNGGIGEQVWFDPVLDAPEFSRREMIWMASRTRTISGSGPVWGPWAVVRIKGEDGNDGVGNDSAYTVYLKGVRPNLTNRYGDLPQSFGCTWQRTTSGLTVGSNQALWMSVRTYQNNVYGPWSDAVRISGDGAPGEDGADFEMIFKQMDRLPTSSDTTPTNIVSQDDYVPTSEGWYDEAKGVDTEHKYEWCCMRYKERGNSLWGDWVGPFAWSVYGDTGMDGASVQYVFKRTTAEEGTPARPEVNTEGYTNEQGEYIPKGWSDDPLGVNSYYIKEWVSIRRKGEKQETWSGFSDPALWATYSQQHKIEIKNGTWWIDDVDTGVKAEGEDGKGVAIKGAVDYYSAAEATAAGGGATSLQGVTNAEIGDCYAVKDNGYLYAYQGDLGGNWSANWYEIGEFKGEPGTNGTSQFFHVAWAYDISFDANNVAYDSNTIYTDYANLPIATYGYPEWVGLCVTNSTDNPTGQDPSQASSYDWNHVRGKDGSDFERVYIRTQENVRPIAAAKSNNDDEYYPLCTNSTSCGAEGTTMGAETIYRFSDNPKGPIPAYPYEWMAERKKKDGVWGEFGDLERKASLWSVYSKPPTITVDSDGYWLIDGQRIPDPNNSGEYIRAKGEKGDGIAIKNSYSSLDELQQNVTNPSIGDCYYITSGNDMGHLFMWNGSNWQDIGEIKGEPGQSQYMFIAWATNVSISNNTVTAVNGFSTNSGTGYNWVGLLAYDSPTLPTISQDTTDPIKLAFKWNYIKGMDGDQYEYVYIRTTTNDNPGVMNSGYPSGYTDSRGKSPTDDDFLPADGNGLSGNAAINEYTDDPNGVNDTYQFEWECCRRKTAGSWGAWSSPYLVHNWAKDGEDGAGQAYVDTEGVDNVVIDCGSDGKPKDADTININAKLYFGETAQTLSTSNSQVTVVIDGFTEGIVGTTSKFRIRSNSSGYIIDLFIKTGGAISSGTITIYLESSDGEHSATKVINVIANKDGAPGNNGNNGDPGPCLRFRGEYSSTVDSSSTDGYVWNSTFRDCVKYNGTYYLVNTTTNGGTALGTPPNNNWMSAGGNLKFFATELLLAENAVIQLLSTNKLVFTDSNGKKTAGINEDQHGSYIMYYTESPYGKRREDSYDGWTYYYANDADNTLLWKLGPSGVIIQVNTVATMTPIVMSLNIVRVQDVTQSSSYTMTTRYIYSNNGSSNDGCIYGTSAMNNGVPIGTILADGTYALEQEPHLEGEIESEQHYYLNVAVVSGGKITDRNKVIADAT